MADAFDLWNGRGRVRAGPFFRCGMSLFPEIISTGRRPATVQVIKLSKRFFNAREDGFNRLVRQRKSVALSRLQNRIRFTIRRLNCHAEFTGFGP